MAKYKLLLGTHMHHGERLKAGDVIESAYDLTKVFVNKYVRVDDFAAPVASQGDNPAPGRPVRHPAGPGRPQAKPQAPPAIQKSATDVALGRDVTKNFPQAVDEDFKVYKKGTVYFVYDLDDVSSPLNAEGVAKTEVDAIIQEALSKP
jgi:hypothetical protein